ncbi:MAG: DUF4097 family beta strand repeat-containing protein [Ktedonobacterales bacterium]
MDEWTTDPLDPHAEPQPDAQAEASPAAGPDDLPAAGYEQPAAPEHAIGEEMAESEGGPFTGHAQPIGDAGVVEGNAHAEADEPQADEPADEATPAASGGALRIEIDEAEGNLTIVGGAEQITVHARRWPSQEDAIEYEDGVRFTQLPGGAELRTPHGVTIIVHEVGGDLRCERLDGELRVNRAQGDVRIEDVAVARLNWIAGDLVVDHVGELVGEDIGGDAWLANVQQATTLSRVGGDLEARRGGGVTVTETVGGDVEIERCEYLTVGASIGGDVEIRRAPGSIKVSHVGGDLDANDVRDVEVGSVGGDLELNGVAGQVNCGSVGGDVEMTNTFGLVTLGGIGGDLTVERAPGGLVVSRTGGDATIDTLLRPEAKYVVNAGSDITLRVRGEVNARFVAQSFGGEIHTRLPLTVEKGRRRNLVGALGNGSATVTLQSGGDISIVAADGQRGDYRMSDDFDNQGNQGNQGNPDDQGDAHARTFEGAVGGRKFRVRVENAPGRAGFQFKGPFTPEDEEQAREFRLDWERGRGPRASGEYGEQLNDLRDQAETLARRAGEEARKYADMATKRARETDWESVGAEIRSTIERAMADLEDAFGRVRRDWDPRGGSSGSGGSSSGPSGRPSSSGPQRVRIEHDDEPQASGAGASYGEPAQPQDRDALRRQTLEDLRNGRITLADAERRLNDLR